MEVLFLTFLFSYSLGQLNMLEKTNLNSQNSIQNDGNPRFDKEQKKKPIRYHLANWTDGGFQNVKKAFTATTKNLARKSKTTSNQPGYPKYGSNSAPRE